MKAGATFPQAIPSAKTSHADANAPIHALDQCFFQEIGNHQTAIVLYYMHYNFARVHQTLRVIPAMKAGITNHVWSLEEIVGLLP